MNGDHGGARSARASASSSQNSVSKSPSRLSLRSVVSVLAGDDDAVASRRGSDESSILPDPPALYAVDSSDAAAPPPLCFRMWRTIINRFRLRARELLPPNEYEDDNDKDKTLSKDAKKKKCAKKKKAKRLRERQLVQSKIICAALRMAMQICGMYEREFPRIREHDVAALSCRCMLYDVLPLNRDRSGYHYPFDSPDTKETIVCTREQGVPQIHRASLEKLVERMTMTCSKDPDLHIRFIILLTFHSYTNAHTLLTLLFRRYFIPMPKSTEMDESEVLSPKAATLSRHETFIRHRQAPTQIRVFSVLKHWVEDHFDDFMQDGVLFGRLLAFIEYVAGEAGDWSSGRYLRDDGGGGGEHRGGAARSMSGVTARPKRGLSWNARTNPWTTKLALQLRNILYRKREIAEGYLLLSENVFQTSAKVSSAASFSTGSGFGSMSASNSFTAGSDSV